jgi:PEP-CTERM motif
LRGENTMSMTDARMAIPLSLLGCLCVLPAAADTFTFSTGDPDGKMATATRPDASGFEIESADDFVLTRSTSITSATFTGLAPAGATVSEVVVEIYRVFPKDSDVGRTSGPPVFSTPNVPTRVNSPSDVAFQERDSATDGLSFTKTSIGSFTASNSVQPGGIHPKPNQTTGGDGAVTGDGSVFNITFTTPFLLPADHYFFVPQVELSDGAFLWLSAARPIAASGTPFPPGVTDLQSWTRDESEAGIDPDWLRVGTDIVGGTPAPTFNAAFSVSGTTIPEPSTWAMMLLGFTGLSFAGYRQARKVAAASA